MHVFTEVYFPACADQFGFQNSKTKISFLIQFSFPFGSILCFVATTFLGDYKYVFVLLAFLLLLSDFILLFMPDKFFSSKIFFYETMKQEYDGRASVYSLFEVNEEKMKENQAEREKTLKNPSLWYQLLKTSFATIVLE